MRLGSLQPEAAYSLTRRVPCRSSGPRMSVSLPAGEINERLPGERRVEAEAGIQGAPVSRAKAVRAQEIQIEVEPATPHPPHPFSLRRSPSCLVSPSDRSEDWIIVLRLSLVGAELCSWEVVGFISSTSCHLYSTLQPITPSWQSVGR